MKKIVYCLIMGALLTTLIVVGCAPKVTPAPTPTPAPAPALPGEITIVSNSTMSGVGAAWGLAFTRTHEAVIDEINEKGGLIVGGKPYKIKFVKLDNKRDPATSVENTKRAIFVEKATVVFHHGAVAVTPALPILSENKVLSMDISVGPVTLKWPYNFNVLPAGMTRSLLAYKAFATKFGARTAAEINPDNESGRVAESEDRLASKEAGVTIVSHQFYPSGTTDFYPILTKAIAAKPDVIVIGLGEVGDVPLIVKQARELGWKGPLGMTQGSVVPGTLVEIAGKAAEGFVYGTPFHGDINFMSEKEKAWVDYYLKKWGVPFIPDTFGGYKQIDLWVQGVKMADSFDPDKVAAALETGKFVHLGWKIHFVATPDSYKEKPRSLVFQFPLQMVKEGKAVVDDLILPAGVEKVR